MSTPNTRVDLPRFEEVTRRAFLHRSLLGGAALAGLALVGCGDDDADTFQSGGSPTTGAPGTSAAPATTAAPGDTTGDGTGTTAGSGATGDLLPGGAELQIAFTYTVSEGGGRVRNPYIAVWVETPDGTLVNTVAVWYKAREAKYLNKLTRWYNAEVSLIDGGGTDNVESMSGATRPAGAYQLVWDGTDVDGNVVVQGDYVVWIESAREHGPHHLTSGPVTLGGATASATLPDDGELTGITVDFVV